MSPKQGRHRRGPGGPRRTTRSGRTSPAGTARPAGTQGPGPDVSGVIDPTRRQVVSTLVDSARRALTPPHPAPGVVLEQWALGLAVSSFAAEAMPPDFYDDLGRGLAERDDPVAPAVLAALAVVLDHADAAPLRRARREWLAGTEPDADESAVRPRDDDLGIGREVPTGAVTLTPVSSPASPTVVVGFASPGGDHTIGLVVGDEAADLWVGPALVAVVADAEADDDVTVAPLPLADARARAERALAHTELSDLPDEDQAVLPLVTRRLGALPG